MAETPSLSEIANIKLDAETSGVAPRTVIDHSKLVNALNENARFKATQDWNKYTTFLQNKKD